MEVDEGYLRHVVEIIDEMIQLRRDKIVWQALATSLLGDNSEEAFQKLREHQAFAVEKEIEVAEIKQLRHVFALMLEKSLKGEPVQLPIDRIN